MDALTVTLALKILKYVIVLVGTSGWNRLHVQPIKTKNVEPPSFKLPSWPFEFHLEYW